MRILITRYPYESQLSGEEWHTITLSSHLKKRGHKVFFTGSCDVLLHEMAGRNFPSRRSWGGLAVVSKKALLIFPFTAVFIFLNFLRTLLWFKKKHQIDTVYMQSLNEKLLMTPLALLMGMKVVWVEHARIGRWLLKNPFLFLYKMWVPRVTVICVSHQHSKQLSWVKNLNAIVNGIDLSHFRPKKIDKVSFFENFFKCRDNNQLIIGSVARLYEDKGLDYLIKALKKVSKNYPNAKIAIAGIGPEKEELINLAKNLNIEDRIFFIGELNREEIVDFYNAIDVFVLPSSLHDPFGLVAAEAMACCKPVVVTEVCGIADKLTDFSNAIVVKAANEDALANGIEAVFESREFAQKIAEAGYNLCRTQFSLNRMVDEYESLMMSR